MNHFRTQVFSCASLAKNEDWFIITHRQGHEMPRAKSGSSPQRTRRARRRPRVRATGRAIRWN
jgi:hypothetical protein